GAHGMREKNIFLEESSHIPLLVSFPGKVKTETTVNGYVSLVDLFPTILDYLNVPEAKSDGKSLRGLIEGTDTEHGKYVVTEWDRENSPNYMVVKDGWKLIIPYTIKSTVINAMYDLNTDPYEMNNLLGANPEQQNYREKAEELRACLLEWLAEKNSVHYYSVSKRDLLNGGKPTGNNAVFISQNIPKLIQGQKHTVSITVKNTGTTTWTKDANFILAAQNPEGNKTWGPDRVTLNEGDSILPNAEKTFTFEITVPDFDGNYIFQWQMMQYAEESFGEKSELQQLIIGNPGSYLDACDDKTGWLLSQSLFVNTEANKQGTGCIEYSGSGTDEFKKSFSTPFNPGVTEANGVLQFWYYISDAAMIGTSNQVELGSAGKNDTDEYSWKLENLSTGWNLLRLNISEANTIGKPDINAINWFRLYNKKTGTVTTRIDAIQILDKTTVGSSLIKSNSSNKPKVQIFPNPLNGNQLSVNLEGFDKANLLYITIADLLGQILYHKKIENKNELVINTNGVLPKSMYLFSVSSAGLNATTKLIVE
ncbi:MAG: NBR1-Ig-like domain-containing protein, partial [Draconibacterium sp.]|nr:NBR1-Ig-like domain-containing protein [Draconibacterium sp.]